MTLSPALSPFFTIIWPLLRSILISHLWTLLCLSTTNTSLSLVNTSLGNFLVFKGILASIENPARTGMSKSPIITLYLDVSPSLPPEGLLTVGLEAWAALAPSSLSSP